MVFKTFARVQHSNYAIVFIHLRSVVVPFTTFTSIHFAVGTCCANEPNCRLAFVVGSWGLMCGTSLALL